MTPQKPAAAAKKKARWSAAQKAQARTSPRVARGAAALSGRPGRADGARVERSERRPQRDDRGGYQRRDDRSSTGYQGRDERGADRGNQRRDDRSSTGYQGGDGRGSDRGYQRRDGRGASGYPRRDDRGATGYPRRDDRGATGYQGGDGRGASGYQGRDDRAATGYQRRDDRGATGYQRRDDRGATGYQRRDDRGASGYQGRNDRGATGYQGRNDHSDERRDRAATSYQGRDDRGSDRRFQRRDDRGATGYQRRDDRGSTGYQARDDRGATGYQGRNDRGATGYQGRNDRGATGYQRRDDRGRAGYQAPDERRDGTGYTRREERADVGYQRREERAPSQPREDRPSYGADRRPSYGGDARRPFRREDSRPARGEHRGDRPRYEEPRRRPDQHADKLRRQDRPHRDAPDVGAVQDAPVANDNAFAALNLPDLLVRRLARDGITEPFPIQAATIPDALAGRDVLGRGQTGSGKTLAFGLPTLARLVEAGPAQPRRPGALVLVPTRELAIQVSDALEPLAHVVGVRHKMVAGGLAYTGQFAALDRGVDLLIATPGRLIDLIEREAVDLGDVRIAVLDEADHMADMGFLPDVTQILDQIPAGGQRLLFSATLDKGIDEVVERYLVDPVTHSTDDATASVETMDHHVLLIDPQHKKVITADVANREGRTIVFVRTKLGADRVAREIRDQGVLAAALHGGLNQGARNRVLAAFKDGRMPVLVATDVAARGIHVDEVSVVLQVDPPADHKDYLHRAGRTARAGERGTVVTLALPHQRKTVERLVRSAGVETPTVRVAPGDDALLETTGARRTSGVPVPEEAYLRIVEGPPKRSRFGGPRRPGGQGGRSGGYGGGRGGQSGRSDHRRMGSAERG